jgi:lipopolysaccharide export system permease protein
MGKKAILTRYVINEVLKPFILLVLMLSMIMFIYDSYYYLQMAASGTITKELLMPLIFYKNLIALEVLIPLSFYLACIIVLTRMDSQGEMTAILASGSSLSKIFKPILLLTVAIAILTGFFSIFVRPWAYNGTYVLRHYSERDFDISRINPGHFVSFNNGKRIIYADKRLSNKEMENVFLQTKNEETFEVVYAKYAYMSQQDKITKGLLVLNNGTLYVYNLTNKRETYTKFQRIYIDVKNNEVMEYKAKSQSTSTLLKNLKNSRNVAELEWRFTTPFMTLFLGLLAIVLSRSAPRSRNRSLKVIIAMLIYTIYYNLYEIVEDWVENGTIPPIPGTLWVTLLLFLIYLYLRRKSLKDYLY